MKERERRIIDAVLARAEKFCPGALALLGVYGSAVTGDAWEKSDIDLLIVAEGESGKLLADGFILDDTGVGYDLYCTSWESLAADADCSHAHLAKLMDAQLVYCRDEETARRLEGLKRKAADILSSEERFERAERLLRQAKLEYAEACLTENLSRVRTRAGAAVYYLLDAVMLRHGRWFRLGTKRTFEELAGAEKPFGMEKTVMDVMRAGTAEAIRSALTQLFITVEDDLRAPETRAPAGPEALAGTYEEMVSDWRHKMTEAAAKGDVFSSFMNLGSLQLMIHELAEEAGTADQEIMARFDPEDLQANVEIFDAALERYAGEYEKRDMKIRRFENLEAFLADYLPPD